MKFLDDFQEKVKKATVKIKESAKKHEKGLTIGVTVGTAVLAVTAGILSALALKKSGSGGEKK